MRNIQSKYIDPLDQIWLHAAKLIGFSVKRTKDAFATYDGENTLYISVREDLDEDDCLAQMILHEICHSLIEGAASFRMRDWGLENVSMENMDREHACLRLQAFLLQRHGLKDVLAPTTEHRLFYDRLEEHPLENINLKTVRLAKLGVLSSEASPWNPYLQNALEATEHIIRLTEQTTGNFESSLYRLASAKQERHSTKLPGNINKSCGSCAWFENNSCKQSLQAIQENETACERFENEFDCQNCGACCGKAYHSVTVDNNERALSMYPELFIERTDYVELRRQNGACIALKGNINSKNSHACSIYNDRPSCCREFTRGSQHCLEARRRMGLSL